EREDLELALEVRAVVGEHVYEVVLREVCGCATGRPRQCEAAAVVHLPNRSSERSRREALEGRPSRRELGVDLCGFERVGRGTAAAGFVAGIADVLHETVALQIHPCEPVRALGDRRATGTESASPPSALPVYQRGRGTVGRMLVSPRYDGPPIISITGQPDDQLAPVLRQRKRLAAMLVELGDDDWSAPSRCDDWTVQDVVAHMVGVNVFWHASVRAGLGGSPTRVLAGFDPATTPAVMVAAMRELTPTEVLEQFVTSNDEFLGVLAELDDAGWATLAESPAGHVPIRLVAHHALWDCWIHERDIALPLGLTPPAEPDEIGSSL